MDHATVSKMNAQRTSAQQSPVLKNPYNNRIEHQCPLRLWQRHEAPLSAKQVIVRAVTPHNRPFDHIILGYSIDSR
ncbi:hypothetical protein EBZ35_02865 [bacterium]|nr:hypothetical protein [bacterium]